MKNHVVHANVLHELHGIHGYFLVEQFVVTTDANFPFTLIGNMSESSLQGRVRERECYKVWQVSSLLLSFL